MIRAFCLALLLAATPAAADPALFVVRGGAVPLYLFGSIHILRNGEHLFSPKLEKAFDEARACWFEIAERPSAAMLLGLFPGMDLFHPLTPQLPPTDRERLAETVERLMPGALPVINRMRPWLAAMVLLAADVAHSLTPEDHPGVDDALTRRCREAGKPVNGLETLAGLVTLMNAMPQADQINMLRALLRPPNRNQAAVEQGRFQELEDAWQSGDLDAIAALTVAMNDSSPELFGALLTQRNALWATRLDTLLHDPAPLLVTIGAAHLAGPNNLRDLLSARGYTIDRLQ